MLDKPVQARKYLVTCFVISLIEGETIQGRKLQHAAVQNYVKSIYTLYTDRHVEPPYCADVNYITMVLQVVHKYKSIKHQHDMAHHKMAHLMEAARPSCNKDSLEAALTNWMYLGRFTGFSSIEWCQKSSTRITQVDALMDHLWTL